MHKIIHKKCVENSYCSADGIPRLVGYIIKKVCSITYFALAPSAACHDSAHKAAFCATAPISVLSSVCFHCHMYFVFVYVFSPLMCGHWLPPLCIMITLMCFDFAP